MAAIRQKDTDMTSGSIVRHLLAFAVPLMIGNIFQQLYNTVDSVVVGRYVGKEALAAVGSVGPIINMLIGFFSGLASGAGVVISQYYGAHDERGVHDTVQTSIALTLLLSVVLTAIGIWITPLMLRMMQTPDDVFESSAIYLKIYFSGLSGLLVYNMGSGILRAVGDSRRPLYFLIFSAVTNTVLDILFVTKYDMGIAGVAIATIVAQFLSAILILIVLTRSTGSYRVDWKHVRLYPMNLKRVVGVGFPASVQMAITAFSNVFVQSYINRFGSACMAGWTAYGKIDSFGLLPIMSLSMAVTTFVGQNLGARNPARARKGTNTAIVMGWIISMVILIPLMFFAPQMIALFNDEPEVLEFGTLFIRMITPFYLMLCVNQVYACALRGAGDARAPMVIVLCSFVAFRQVYLFIVYKITESIIPVALGYPAGWVVCSIALFLYYRSGRWEKYAERIVGDQ